MRKILCNDVPKIEDKITLVISGGGAKGFYGLGVLNGLEELGIDKNIESIYGVSIGAIIASYRAAGYKANEIFESFLDFSITSSINFIPRKSLFKHDKLIKKFSSELPDSFEKLNKKIYIGCADIKTAKYILFNKGELIKPLLGSMSIPGAFFPVDYKKFSLVDGGLINNFPVDIAQTHYPNNKIIGIFLNYFSFNQKVESVYDSLSIAFKILMRSQELNHLKLVDHLFYKQLDSWSLDINKKKMKLLFEQGHQDCISYFKRK